MGKWELVSGAVHSTTSGAAGLEALVDWWTHLWFPPGASISLPPQLSASEPLGLDGATDG